MPGINTSGLPQTADYNLGRGAIYVAPLEGADSRPGAWRHLGNAPAFSVSQEVETLEHQSSRSGLKVTDLEAVTAQTLNVSITLDELSFNNFALWFSGSTDTTYTNPADGAIGTAGAGSIVLVEDDSVSGFPGAKKGVWYDLFSDPNDPLNTRVYDIEDAADVNVISRNATGDTGSEVVLTQYNPTTDTGDFEIDLTMGRIRIVEGSTNVEVGDALRWWLDAPSAARASVEQVRALTTTVVKLAVKFISKNPANNNLMTEYQFMQVTLRADGDLALIGDEFSQMQLTGVAERNEGLSPDSPTLTIRTHDNAIG